ncbi:transaldolase family protein [Streptomyces sp. NPDC059989]|uniref:transaldolase family protein n=1 Tax=Streptomyces sp. NPDC059989 TaxID=3347026 RepID=UPI00367920DF
MLSRRAVGLLEQLAAEGVSPWLADVSGVELLAGAQGDPAGVETAFLQGVVAPVASSAAVRRSCDALRDVFHASEGVHGRVSVPVDPRHAHDAKALIAAARSRRSEVGRANVLMRIPVTRAGLVALEECLALGIGVDADLVFSVERYEELLDVVLRGLERAFMAGLPLADIVATASVPVGLLDAEVNARLAALPVRGPAGAAAATAAARGTAALAVARQIYRAREQRLGSDWWRVLRAAGAMPPGLLWTATGPRHVGALVGWNTAQAASPEVFETAARQVELRGDTLLNAHAEGRGALDALEALGVRMAEVAEVLETGTLARLQREWGRGA